MPMCATLENNQQKITPSLAFSIFTAVFGSSFLFGYHVGVLNAPQTVMGLWIRQVKCRRSLQDPNTIAGTGEDKWCRQLNFTEELHMFSDNAQLNTIWTLSVASLVFASFFGAILTSTFADKIGRRGALWWNSVLGIMAAVVLSCSYLADSYEMLILGRLIAGFTTGVNTALPPVYLNEISPRSLRGAIGVIHPVAASAGLLVARILGLPYILGNEWGWPLLLAVSVVPIVYQLIAFPFCPESPRYLFVEKGDEAATRRALEKLRNTSNVEVELADFQRDYELSKGAPKLTITDLFKDPFLRKTTLIAIGVMVCQHLSGIIAVMYYSTAIFKSAGLVHGNQAIYATIALGGISVLMTVAAVFLVEKAGRKLLLLIGYGGSIVLMSLLVVCTIQTKATQPLEGYTEGSINPWAVGSTLCLVGYSIFVTIGPGSIPNLLVSELFATAPRAAGSSVAVGVNRASGFVIALAFPYIKAALEEYTFVVFIVTLAIALVFTKMCVIETKGKTAEEIQYELRHGQEMSRSSRHSTIVKPETRNVSYDPVESEEKP